MSTSGVHLADGGNLVAGADFSSSQYLAVKASTSADRTLVLASTGGEAITGILQNNPASGGACTVAFDGLVKAQIGTGGVTHGQQLMTEASTGKLVTKTSTNTVVAVAHETIAAGAIGLVRVIPTGG